MTNDRPSDAKARLEQALDRLERAAAAVQTRPAKPVKDAKDERVAVVRGRLDAAIAEIDRLLGA